MSLDQWIAPKAASVGSQRPEQTCADKMFFRNNYSENSALVTWHSPEIYHNRKNRWGRHFTLGTSMVGTLWDVVKIEVLMHMIYGNKPRMRRGSRVLLEGQIVSRDKRTVIDVKIRDIDEYGAILRMPSDIKLPENFSLLVVSDGRVYPARKRRRKGERLELQFIGEMISRSSRSNLRLLHLLAVIPRFNAALKTIHSSTVSRVTSSIATPSNSAAALHLSESSIARK